MSPPRRGHGKWRREAVLIVICPRAPKPAAVLAAVKDKPFGWPPSGGHP